MKNKNIFICVGLISILLLFIGVMYPKQNKREFKNDTSNLISVYLQNENNEYEKTIVKNWPIEEFFLNEIKSSCENNSVLSWKNNKVEVVGNKSDKCFLYFDKKEKDYEYTENRLITGESYEFIVPTTGTYKIELWGASGGKISVFKGGNGAYTYGNIELEKGEKIYIYIGEKGKGPDVEFNYNPSFNGGAGIGLRQTYYGNISVHGGSGGGSTDVRINNGIWDNFESLKSRIMVAAGGGGACNRSDNNGDGDGGAGGTLNGLNGQSINNSEMIFGYGKAYGGTQTSAGITHWMRGTYSLPDNFNPDIIVGGFGYAGIIWGTDCSIDSCQERNNTTWTPWGNQCGGGGGYYGGASNLHGGAGGGSSYISGYMGCVAIKQESTEDNVQPKDDCIDGTKDIACSYHYSGKIFTETKMIAGNETMPSPNGGTEVGHSGNGYARITYLGK